MTERMRTRKLATLVLTYNHEGTIATAIDSILEQETDFGFYALLMDDASTDGTSDICRSYAEKFPDRVVHVRNKANIGVTPNMRQALEAITNPYIAFLEGDDAWCDKQKLQLLVDQLDRNPACSMAGHDTRCRDWKTGREWLFVGKQAGDDPVQTVDGPPGKFRVHPSSRVYRNHESLASLPNNLLLDTHLFRHYLLLGPMAYVNRVMSVFNSTGSGFWSGRSPIDQKIMTLELSYEASRHYRHEKDEFFLPDKKLLRLLKFLLGSPMGWKTYYHISRTLLVARKRIAFRRSA